ncbi:MAG: heme-binding protein [Blastopirellula sp.]|nr:MAG: heme-binding protein [Blastopirellula sp.]
MLHIFKSACLTALITLLAAECAVSAAEPQATDPATMKIKEGFTVELLYSVPKETQGSWVNLCVDPKGRLIVSDQYGKLYRVTPQAIGTQDEIKIEPINVDIGEAQGLLWAFDSLYVVVNKGGKYASGLYRVRDTNGDDQLDTLETLRILKGGAEHGPHAVLPHPDGKSLVVVCGDNTKLTEFNNSLVPQIWDEDLLLPRTYGRGFMKGVLAPGGWIAKTDPDGKDWELIATGFRNEYDAAYNKEGELFSYDADMEWDVNTPWYRPTRVCHVVSGAEFGWRNGSGKWPAFYEDSVPAILDIGTGCPTGVAFGYGSNFPAKYEDALFICDWSYGKMYAVHMEPNGSSYKATAEEFITGTPLPLTDLVINKHDGAMYFAIGGRKTKSGLYRVTYTGKKTDAAGADRSGIKQRQIRRKLESFHGKQHPQAVATALPYLGSEDRFTRFAARIALEHQDPTLWQDQVLKSAYPQTTITGVLSLARVGDKSLQNKLLAKLQTLDFAKLTHTQKLSLMRAYAVVFTRMGEPDAGTRTQLLTLFEANYPNKGTKLNSELTQMLVFLQSEKVAALAVDLLEKSPTQEGQIDLAKHLRHLDAGWNNSLRERYFKWFTQAVNYRGGASFSMFVENIKKDAVAKLTEQELAKLKPILDARPKKSTPVLAENRPFVKKWSIDELAPLVEKGLSGRDFDKGQAMFAAGNCFSCHRFDNQGGAVGPDLTILSGRFSPRDILESVVEPNKVISDQYGAVKILTEDGKVVVGRIANLSGDNYSIITNMLDPGNMTSVNRNKIELMEASKVSMMPEGLLNTLSEDEIKDLMAYLLSRGDRNHKMFKQD